MLRYCCGKNFLLPSHILSLAVFEVSSEGKELLYNTLTKQITSSPIQLNVYVVKIFAFVSIQNFNHNFFDMQK